MRPATRRLTVLGSLDVAGYTALVEQDERGTLMELAAIRRQILRPTLDLNNGNLFKTMGDGALVEFPSVQDAVEWAIAFQTAMHERNRDRGERALRARLAIALADVFVQGSDRFGAAVGFVVRLQQAAPVGGIAITHSVRWQLVRPIVARFLRVPEVRLKGIEDPIEIFTWLPPGESDEEVRQQPAAAEPATPVIAAPPMGSTDLPSIAILAFDNMSGDIHADSIADGIVEEITATLSRIRDFTVIARNSAYAYKGRPRDVREVSRALGVRYVLEGSLRKAADRIRVTAQLVDATTGNHLWADSYEGVLHDLFDFEDEIAERVAGAVHPSIRAAEIALARRKRPENLVAYDLVLRALPHLWAHRRKDNETALALLDQALSLDPDYARAAALAAWARGQQIVYNWTADIAAERAAAEALIARVGSGADDDPMALTALGTAIMLALTDIERAAHFVDRALALDPNQAWAWTRRGFLHVYRDDPQSGIPCFERAIRLSPLDPFHFNCYIGLGLAHFAAGAPREAARWTERALGERLGMTWPYRDLTVFLAHAGEIEAARKALARLTATRPHLTLRYVEDSLGFMTPPLRQRYVEGLRLAGLSE